MLRRQFLGYLNTAVAGMFLRDTALKSLSVYSDAGTAVTPLRVALCIVTSAQTRGLDMGVEETQHAATLLGKSIHVTRIISPANLLAESVTQRLQQEQFSAIVGGDDAEVTAALGRLSDSINIVFMNTACSANALRGSDCNRFTFHVAASDNMKRDALALISDGEPRDCVGWHESLSRYGADTLNSRFRSKFGIGMGERDWNDWFAMKALWESYLRADSASATALRAALVSSAGRFDGHKGKVLTFRSWNQQLRQPLYVRTMHGDRATSFEEVPSPNADGMSSAELLDQLGDTERDLCRSMS